MVPQGIAGHTNAFFDTYGDAPDIAKAARHLAAGASPTRCR